MQGKSTRIQYLAWYIKKILNFNEKKLQKFIQDDLITFKDNILELKPEGFL